jgi:NAD(P)-dependent dehydrogenase (short-subunit alcohol dehydrogenase family)
MTISPITVYVEQVWFITGSSRGLGRALARAALAAGDSVVVTAREPAQLRDFVDEYQERALPLALDVTRIDEAKMAIANARDHFGRLDVIVNNAGYANVAPIETVDDGDFRAQFETNFWGVYNVSKAAIPILREQQQGVIMQISSVGGRVGGSPGIASYQAAKFAMDGFSRVLRAETAPFGIKVVVVEPSGFRTDWAGSSMTVQEVPDAYAPTVGVWNSRVRHATDGPAGDPTRAAEILVKVAKRSHIPHNLPLGVNAVEMSVRLDERMLARDQEWRDVGRSADFGESYPIEFPPDTASDTE